MSEEGAESWDEEQIEEWEHDRWLKIQNMGNNFYKDDQEMEVDPFKDKERVRLEEEEKNARATYFKIIKKGRRRGLL